MIDVFASIERPTLVLDEERTRRNIRSMAAKAARSSVRFRPHFKTHQSAIIGEWFRQESVTAITVSSIDMATYFAAHGWDDITIAFPVNVRQMGALNALSAQVTLNLLVESTATVGLLNDGLHSPANVWLKVDTGYGRTGIRWDDDQALDRLVDSVEQAAGGHLHLSGLLSHAGHTYLAGDPHKIKMAFEESVERLAQAQAHLASRGHDLELSAGDTPGCSLAEGFKNLDEIRPGNFVFYDLAQKSFGACDEDEISVAVACPVVAKHASRGQIVIHGGAVHLSLDRVVDGENRTLFGGVALPVPGGWTRMFKDSYVKSLSQEHGIVQAEAALIGQVEVGDLLLVIPVHSCLAADLMGRYVTLDGTTIEMMPRMTANG